MKFQEHVSLAHFSSYRIGGPARYFFEPRSEGEILTALRAWESRREMGMAERPFILGGGTNLLIDDAGFNGLVLKPAIHFLRRESGNRVSVGAGVLVSELLRFLVREGLAGFEWAGGLPGTVGGAVRGNAGCFGGETKDAIVLVRSLSLADQKITERSKEECDFSYRSSIFKKKGDEIILSATFALSPGNSREIAHAMEEKIAYRTSRHPLEYPNIGSIFKNVDVRRFSPEKLSAVQNVIKSDPFPVVPTAHLIAESGLRGVSSGGAMISPKHPNFIVNALGASAADVRALIDLVRGEVKRRFSVDLEEEVQLV